MVKVTYLISRRGEDFSVTKRVTDSDDFDWDADIAPATMYREIPREDYTKLMNEVREKYWGNYEMTIPDDDIRALPYGTK